jgi:hypothetical protein
MVVDEDNVRKYLIELKKLITDGHYRIDTNSKRQKNSQLYTDYIIDENKSKIILLDLEVEDFSHTLNNEHKGFEHEILYVFGKEIGLTQRFGTEVENVALYIKFNKLGNSYVIVISFHKQDYPLSFPFK